MPVPGGSFFYVLRVPRFTDPAQAFSLAARCAPEVLTALPIPPNAAARPFVPRTFPICRAFAALCTVLPLTRLPPQALSVGVLDPDGVLRGRMQALLPLAADVRVVTNDPRRFEADVLSARQRFGALLTVGEDAALLGRCDAVVCPAPEAAIRNVPVVLSCVPSDGAFSLADVPVPQAYARLCPDGTQGDLFAAALFEKCGVRAPELLACTGILRGGERLDVRRAALCWRARTETQRKKLS